MRILVELQKFCAFLKAVVWFMLCANHNISPPVSGTCIYSSKPYNSS